MNKGGEMGVGERDMRHSSQGYRIRTSLSRMRSEVERGVRRNEASEKRSGRGG